MVEKGKGGDGITLNIEESLKLAWKGRSLLRKINPESLVVAIHSCIFIQRAEKVTEANGRIFGNLRSWHDKSTVLQDGLIYIAF